MAQPTSTDTARNWAAITKSDTVPIAPVPVGIYCGGSGDIVAKGVNGVSGTFAVFAGQVLPIRAQFVMAATTATGLVALYNE